MPPGSLNPGWPSLPTLAAAPGADAPLHPHPTDVASALLVPNLGGPSVQRGCFSILLSRLPQWPPRHPTCSSLSKPPPLPPASSVHGLASLPMNTEPELSALGALPASPHLPPKTSPSAGQAPLHREDTWKTHYGLASACPSSVHGEVLYLASEHPLLNPPGPFSTKHPLSRHFCS